MQTINAPKKGKPIGTKRLDHNQHPIRKRLQKTPHWWQKIRLTPELIYHWLWNSQALSEATGRAFNRPIWLEQAQEVAALIRKGEFPHDSKDRITISYTKEWGCVIFNGQHRLAAIVLANKAVTTRVLSNIWLSAEEAIRRVQIARGEREEIDPPKWWLRDNGVEILDGVTWT
jgi:hypothetical protein